MTIKELYVQLLDEELPAFKRVIAALPQDKLDYKPDPKARTALEMINLFIGEAMMSAVLLNTGVIDAAAENPLKDNPVRDTAEVSAHFEKAWGELKEKALSMSDQEWEMEGKMVGVGEHPWVMPRGPMALRFLLDLIHHRGQLSTYIRPMGGKNPSIYGPSADSMPGQ